MDEGIDFRWAACRRLPPHLRAFREAGCWPDLTVAELAHRRAYESPRECVFVDRPDLTYATIFGDAEALAVAFSDLGLMPGDVISVLLPNWHEAAIINVAAALSGIVINPIIPIYRKAEITQLLGDCRSRLLFAAESVRRVDFAAMIEAIRSRLPALRHVFYVRGGSQTTSYDALLDSGRGRTLPVRKVDPDSIKLLLYTSGTTGTPKAVLHSHNTIARMFENTMRHWQLKPGEALLMPSPITHLTGFGVGLELPFMVGTRTLLMERWDAREAAQLIDRYGIVGTVSATPFLKELTDAAREIGTRLPSLRFFACGGAAVPPEVIRNANATFAQPCAFRIFGCTETPAITLGWLGVENGECAATTDGEIIDYEVRVVAADGTPVPFGTEGEILARGPAMFLGYADAIQTREALTEDGYYRTGDLGVVTPQRAIIVTGRKKDIIIRGGENISAKEVEDVLHRHPAVAEAAVVSMPHPRLGEGVCAFIVLRPNEIADPHALAAFVADCGLARQKCPEHVEIVEALPRTATGKVRKDILREEIRAKKCTAAP